MKMLLWFVAILAPVYSAGYIIHGKVYINSSEATYTRLTPNYFLSGWEWGAKEDEMNRSWKMRVRLNDSFTKRCSDCGEECKGHFRASQTACSLNGSSSIVVCKLEANTYEHEVMIRLGFELQGNAIIRFLFDGHRIGRFMREGRETLQIYLFGTRPLSRNKYFNFILECRSAECFLNDLTLLAYQAWYDC